MSSAAALPSVKTAKVSLQEQANMQTTRQSNDRIRTVNIISHFWHFGVGEYDGWRKKLENGAFR